MHEFGALQPGSRCSRRSPMPNTEASSKRCSNLARIYQPPYIDVSYTCMSVHYPDQKKELISTPTKIVYRTCQLYDFQWLLQVWTDIARTRSYQRLLALLTFRQLWKSSFFSCSQKLFFVSKSDIIQWENQGNTHLNQECHWTSWDIVSEFLPFVLP